MCPQISKIPLKKTKTLQISWLRKTQQWSPMFGFGLSNAVPQHPKEKEKHKGVSEKRSEATN